MVLMSLCFYILFSVDAIYSTGVGMYSTMILYTYVFAPMLSLVFIYLAHDMQPKSPITEYRPYKVAAISSAVAAVLFLSLTGFGGFIQNLSRRNYGEFTNDLERISSQLSWGIPLRQVFMDFIKRTKSWLSQLVIFLLVEGIDVGGGTISMIESLTRFNNMTQDVEREKKMTSRPFILIPYFAAIMLMSTTLMTLMFVGKTASMAPESMGQSRID